MRPFDSALAMLRCVKPAYAPSGAIQTGRSDHPRTGGCCARRNALVVYVNVALDLTVSRMPSSICLTVNFVAGPIALGVFVGASAGSRLAHRVDVRLLRGLFVVVLVYTAIQMLLRALQ